MKIKDLMLNYGKSFSGVFGVSQLSIRKILEG